MAVLFWRVAGLLVVAGGLVRGQNPAAATEHERLNTRLGEPGVAPQTSKRPKIGLTLAGGAAYGLAHAGVLEWLEEHRIPIDSVAGTSMGALVGGLYATGMDAKEVSKFIRAIRWESALASSPPYRQLSFRRKEDYREYPSQFELGIKKGALVLPSGLSPGHGVGLVLSKFTAQYGDLKSFDDLAIPFRCVSTDLVTSEQVVFDKGSLFEALRATMSLPALFAPVRSGNRVLVDGGLTNNLPVDVSKKMGAERTIAVVLDRPPDPSAYGSLLGVAGRSLSVMVTDNERRNMPLADLLVSPDLSGLGQGDYGQFEELRKRGYEAAERKAIFLNQLAVSEQEWTEYQTARKAKLRTAPLHPEFVDVTGEIAPKRAEALKQALKDAIEPEMKIQGVEAEMYKLTGMGRYTTARYEFVEKDGKPGLAVKIEQKSYGPPFLRPAFLIDGSTDQGLRFGIGARLTFIDLGSPASEWRSDFSVGQNNRLATEYYWRIRGSKYFVAPRGSLGVRELPLYSGRQRVAEVRSRTAELGLDFGYAFGRFQEFRIGYETGHLNTRLRTGLEFDERLRGKVAGFRSRWVWDRQDSPFIPRSGWRVGVEGRWLTDFPGIDRGFAAGESTASWARSYGSRWSTIWNFAGGTTIDDPSASVFFNLGGATRLSALARNQFTGTHYYYNGFYALRSVSARPLSTLQNFYLAGGLELGNVWVSRPVPRPFFDGVAGIMGQTAIGVVFFGGAYGEQGERKVLFRVGRFF